MCKHQNDGKFCNFRRLEVDGPDINPAVHIFYRRQQPDDNQEHIGDHQDRDCQLMKMMIVKIRDCDHYNYADHGEQCLTCDKIVTASVIVQPVCKAGREQHD